MQHLSSMTRRRLATALLAAAFALPVDATTAPASQATAPAADDQNTQGNTVDPIGSLPGSPKQGTTASSFRRGSKMTVPTFAPLFVTPGDAHTYWEMLHRSYGSSALDPRAVAKSFIKERLGIDGDAYVVAHFATTEKYMEGSADNDMVLIDALMNAFPDHSRYSFFGAFSDSVANLQGGGKSPSLLGFLGQIFTCQSAAECFTRAGRFLWSRTGPGYIYNTFIGEGNVIDGINDDSRPIDLAFGIYPRTSNFLPENRSTILLSQVIDKFKEEGLFSELPYIKRLKSEFDEYWKTRKTEWPQLARYRFVHEARRALGRRTLTRLQYELVMKGGAPRVPLQGPIEVRQLRNTPPDASVQVRRFDINGYSASDILRFMASDGSQVMYIPGAASPFVTFRNEDDLRQWVVRRARNRGSLDELLSHFSIYNGQDGAFRTGVAQGLAHLADGRWSADGGAIDVTNLCIHGDVFEDMRVQVEARLRDDARMRTSTAWDAWRTTLTRTIAVLGPLGYVPPLALPVQASTGLVSVGTEIDEGINGRTTEERNSSLGNAVMTVVTNFSAGAALRAFAPREGAVVPPSSPVMPEIDVVPPSSSESTALLSLTDVPGTDGQGAEARIAYSLGEVSSGRSPGAVADPWRTSTPASTSTKVQSASEPGGVAAEPNPKAAEVTGSLDEDALELQQGKLGYLVQRVSNDADDWSRRIIDLKKSAIDDRRHRLDDFKSESLTTNRAGYQLSFDRSLVFRVDSRGPAELLRGNGFGPSSEFNDLKPMLKQPTTIGSGSLMASNVVLESWQKGFSCLACRPNFHQYAVWTERRPVATASDNHDARFYDFFLDEVHFPADVPSKNIYIIDSADPTYARALANIYRSPYVSTPYGVPLSAFQEYLGGQLDINVPNKYTDTRMTGLPLPAAPSQVVPLPVAPGGSETLTPPPG